MLLCSKYSGFNYIYGIYKIIIYNPGKNLQGFILLIATKLGLTSENFSRGIHDFTNISKYCINYSMINTVHHSINNYTSRQQSFFFIEGIYNWKRNHMQDPKNTRINEESVMMK